MRAAVPGPGALPVTASTVPTVDGASAAASAAEVAGNFYVILITVILMTIIIFHHGADDDNHMGMHGTLQLSLHDGGY